MEKRTMEKQTKKILPTTILLILLTSIAIATLPNAYAVDENNQQKTMTILNDVVGLNTNSYVPSLKRDNTSTLYGLSQQELNYNFTSDEGSLRVMCSFVENKLHQMYLSNYAGKLSLDQPATDTLSVAKVFVERYQTYTGDPFYGTLSAMIRDVPANKNVTKIVGNIKFEISILGDQTHTDLIWTYVDANGIPAPSKNVVLSYDRGSLQCFMDNWHLYKIAGVPKLSSEDAKSIALKAAQSFSYITYDKNGVPLTVSGFKAISFDTATLSYLNYNEQTSGRSARSGDPFTLYPSWYVPIGFDKHYPGSVTGARVRVWADTGEVSTVDPMIYGATPLPDDITVKTSNVNPMLIAPPIIVISVVTSICLLRAKARALGQKRPLKTVFLRLSIPLLCILISTSLVLAAVPNAEATKKAEAYASTYGQVGDESYYAAVVLNNIWYNYQSIGVAVANNYGSGTTRTAILANIDSDESNYDCVTVFHSVTWQAITTTLTA